MTLKKESIYARIMDVTGSPKSVKLAKMLGISEQAVSHWKSGATTPSFETVAQVSNLTGASIHWLFTGDGEKYVGQGSQSFPKQLALNALPDDTAPAPLIPEMGYPTAQHKIVDFPLRGAISGQKIEHEVSRVLVPSNLVSANSILFKIKGDNLAAEGLHEGDVLIARPANGDADGKIVIATLDGKTIVRHLSVTKKLALLSPIEGNRPVIKSALADLTINFVVTSIARSFE